MKLEEKALRVIEAISSDDLMEELAMRPPSDKTAAVLAEKLGRIYKYAHIARNPSCIRVHDNWVAELKKVYAKFRRAKIF